MRSREGQLTGSPRPIPNVASLGDLEFPGRGREWERSGGNPFLWTPKGRSSQIPSVRGVDVDEKTGIGTLSFKDSRWEDREFETNRARSIFTVDVLLYHCSLCPTCSCPYGPSGTG